MKIDRDSLMKMINLEQRRSLGERFFSGLGLVLGGAIVGAGVALMLTPKTGAQLRKELAENGLNPILQRFDHSAASQNAEHAPRA